jgi:chitodextrinase
MKTNKIFSCFILICISISVNAINPSRAYFFTDPYLAFDPSVQYNCGTVAANEVIELTFKVTPSFVSRTWHIERSDQNFFTALSCNGTNLISTNIYLPIGNVYTVSATLKIPNTPGDFNKTLTFIDTGDLYNVFYLDFVGTVSGSGTDTEPPTAPTNLHVVSSTTNSLSLDWNASTDNIGVAGYKIYINGYYHSSTTATEKTISELTSNATYNIQIIAYDAANNLSYPASINANTEPEPFEVAISGPIVANSIDYYTWSAVVHGGDVGEPPYTYLWEYHTELWSTWYNWGTTQSRYSQMPIDLDLYLRLTVTDANNVERVAYHTTYNSGGGFHKSAVVGSLKNIDIEKFDEIEVFPNPANEKVYIGLPSVTENTYIYLYAPTGKLLERKKITKTKEEINLSKQSAGIYLLKIYTDKQIFTRKIVKK